MDELTPVDWDSEVAFTANKTCNFWCEPKSLPRPDSMTVNPSAS